MADKYIMLDLDDPKISSLADVISNKTSKKILALLAEKEMSESEMAEKLNLGLNTIDYNVKKLVDAGLIEKVNKFFWSSRGKRIISYKLSNKKIVISPRSAIKGIIPTVLITGAIALGIRYFLTSQQKSPELLQTVAENAPNAAKMADSALASTAGSVINETMNRTIEKSVDFSATSSSMWFLFGALTALLIFLIWNWRKIW